jgi:hypothetical protein
MQITFPQPLPSLLPRAGEEEPFRFGVPAKALQNNFFIDILVAD